MDLKGPTELVLGCALAATGVFGGRSRGRSSVHPVGRAWPMSRNRL
jgi:hypothetical protein